MHACMHACAWMSPPAASSSKPRARPPPPYLRSSSSSWAPRGGDPPPELRVEAFWAIRARSAANACSCWGLDVQGSDRNPGGSALRRLLLGGDEDDEDAVVVVVRLGCFGDKGEMFRRTVDISRWRDARWEGGIGIDVLTMFILVLVIEAAIVYR